MSETVQEALQRSLRRLQWITVGLFALLIALGVLGYVDAQSKRDDLRQATAATTAALCALRHDLEVRVQSSRDFLAEHPDGIPGISRAAIEKSIRDQTRTIDTLSNLVCEPPA